MSTLTVPGARLHYDLHGNGPLLILLPGASGDARPFTTTGFAQHLAAHHTVLTYDRRGFSRSDLNGPQDYHHRLDTDADDVEHLIQHTGHQTATVFGTSSGALVALRLLARHPTAVSTVIAYEPPALRLLPDYQHWTDLFHRIYDLYRSAGIEPALHEFRTHTFTTTDRHAMTRAADLTNPQIRANATYWFEHELRQYPADDLHLDTLATHAARIVPAAGRDSRDHVCHQASLELSHRLGRTLAELPGGHVGFATQPADFARELRALSGGGVG
ncbi:MAG: alpha/beta fold hydrolase [Mycobacteriales bacterium]